MLHEILQADAFITWVRTYSPPDEQTDTFMQPACDKSVILLSAMLHKSLVCRICNIDCIEVIVAPILAELASQEAA